MEWNQATGDVPYRRQQRALRRQPLNRASGGQPGSNSVHLNVEGYAIRTGLFSRLWSGVSWPYRNWELNFHFRNQDYDAERLEEELLRRAQGRKPAGR